MSTWNLRTIGARPHAREATAILGQGSTVTLGAAAQEWLAAIDTLSDTDRDYAARAATASRAADPRWWPSSMTVSEMQQLALAGRVQEWLKRQPAPQPMEQVLTFLRRGGLVDDDLTVEDLVPMLQNFVATLLTHTEDGLLTAYNSPISHTPIALASTVKGPLERRSPLGDASASSPVGGSAGEWADLENELLRVLVMGEWTDLVTYRRPAPTRRPTAGSMGGPNAKPAGVSTPDSADDDVAWPAVKELLRAGQALHLSKVQQQRQHHFMIVAATSTRGLTPHGRQTQKKGAAATGGPASGTPHQTASFTFTRWPVRLLRRWSPDTAAPRVSLRGADVLVADAGTPQEAVQRLIAACRLVDSARPHWGVYLQGGPEQGLGTFGRGRITSRTGGVSGVGVGRDLHKPVLGRCANNSFHYDGGSFR